MVVCQVFNTVIKCLRKTTLQKERHSQADCFGGFNPLSLGPVTVVWVTPNTMVRSTQKRKAARLVVDRKQKKGGRKQDIPFTDPFPPNRPHLLVAHWASALLIQSPPKAQQLQPALSLFLFCCCDKARGQGNLQRVYLGLRVLEDKSMTIMAESLAAGMVPEQ